jgi:hypothetical protein
MGNSLDRYLCPDRHTVVSAHRAPIRRVDDSMRQSDLTLTSIGCRMGETPPRLY